MHSDRLGWVKGLEDKWNLTLFIENGRIWDRDEKRYMTGLREIAEMHEGEFRMTATQNYRPRRGRGSATAADATPWTKWTGGRRRRTVESSG